MRPSRTTVLVLTLAAGTALGLATPAAGAQAATWTRTVIYQGDGGSAVGPAALPAPGQPELSTEPKTITAAGAGKLEMDVPSLQGRWGACGSDCSEWVFKSNGAVYVSSFSVGGETAHALQPVPITSAWEDLGDGTWTPLYLTWQGGCIHLNTETHDWSAVQPATCP